MQRRDFFKVTSAFLAGSSAITQPGGAVQERAALPVVISSANGMKAAAKAMESLRAGGKPLDAVIAGVNIVEDDPNDSSVGYGGLPNEEGEVELDASVMDGPTCRCGAVGALKHIRNPSKVARLVMERTDHIFLVGEGALKFALRMGFEKENLLTEESRRKWLEWRSKLSARDAWLTEEESGTEFGEVIRHYGTISCLGVDAAGNIAGTTTTSGLSWKIPGRVGDSPIIGAGLYVDNDVGAAGSTGRGEANIKVCGAHAVVELMRQGKSPEQACLAVLERVVRTTKEKRLLGKDGRPAFQLNFYAVNKKGEFGGAALYPSRFCVNTGAESRLVNSAYLFKRAQA
ncbi:MAG: N(4)-(beta-N-acetylglucosaminyl)-L-asparaginase [Acidobacteria bacterium]|nr:N(4)-(beta-N-acetylglucosaminyl)-L-asparaginase [Acidobacteriota bacterium]